MKSSLNQRLKSAYIPFTMAHSLFYDVLGSSEAVDSSPLLMPEMPPAGWQRVEYGPWTVFVPPVYSLPEQGWKVHVAALPGNARRVADIAVRACWDLGVPVKTLRTERTVLATQLKYAAPESSGKVVTAYPATPALAELLLERLVAGLADEPGPRIVGEVPVAGAPIYLRYGGFGESWCTGADGRLRPGWTRAGRAVLDRRGPAGALGAPPLPEPLQRFRAADLEPKLEIDEVVVLHRSTGGGVYRARWRGRSTVVLKEARRHAGLDVAGVDATARLRHEHAVLTRLAGTGLVPEVLDLISLRDSDFLVLEYIPGQTLSAGLTTNPAIRPDATASEEAAYLGWVERTAARLRVMAQVLADHGVAHGDLHPGNVLEGDERLVLVDLESASLDGRAVSTGITALNIPGDAIPTLGSDLRAVELIRLTLLAPHLDVLNWRPELEQELEQAALADLGPGPAVVGPAPDRAALVRGLTAAATVHRTDRLLPGDIAQFTTPGGGLGLLHGATGVCLALQATGALVPEPWLDWIVAAAGRERPVGGLGHGLEGVALALALLGRPEQARTVARRAAANPRSPLPPSWEYGHAGRALAFTELAGLLGPEFDEPAQHHLAATTLSVSASGPRPGSGLLDGWAGVALALIAIADISGDDRAQVCLRAAHQAVLREAENAVTVGPAVLIQGTGRLLPDLAQGSAALGLAAAALLSRPEAAGLGTAEIARLEPLVAGVRQTCRTPAAPGPGLGLGRCGLLATLRRLAGDDDAGVALHEGRVGWNVMPLPGGDQPATVLLGHAGYRLSTDLATGSAGALVALAPLAQDALHAVLRLPRHQSLTPALTSWSASRDDKRQDACVTPSTR
ncbi:hypothetical protein LWF15_27600 [Kineosporia rhizophila]|uniref:class III lanthionine synthetase LanKC N-terminal domain-containing protein n=1 Tax=Kineosporia rhizophila TaxID=84633 RepID=UPI001E639545|nr:hypothetical protein [Kineosporia rhizophila]MCE0539269.1 hypothetical protein [Kineosporia rhizophila]